MSIQSNKKKLKNDEKIKTQKTKQVSKMKTTQYANYVCVLENLDFSNKNR